MSAIAVAVRYMVAAGMDADTIAMAVADMEAAQKPVKSSGAARTARWRARLGLSSAEWEELTEYVRDRDGHTCAYCGSTDGTMHVDHVVPLIQGGNNLPGNLVAACRSCNVAKSGRSAEEWL